MLLSTLLFSLSLAFAQPGMNRQERKKEIEAMKIGFITRKLQLTPEEAQVFWPVYNEFNKKRETLMKKRREKFMNREKDFDEMSDKEIEEIVDGVIAFKQRELDLRKAYHAKFKSVLPIRKVAKLYRAEEQLKKELLKKMREHRKQKGKPHPPR